MYVCMYACRWAWQQANAAPWPSYSHFNSPDLQRAAGGWVSQKRGWVFQGFIYFSKLCFWLCCFLPFPVYHVVQSNTPRTNVGYNPAKAHHDHLWASDLQWNRLFSFSGNPPENWTLLTRKRPSSRGWGRGCNTRWRLHCEQKLCDARCSRF